MYLPYSATKTVASALIGMAIKDGYIDLDDYLTDYIQVECEDGCPDALTQIKHTLSQASRPTRGTTFRYESGTQALLNNLSKLLGNATGMPTVEYMRQKFEPLGMTNFNWLPEDGDGNLRFGACGELCFGSCRDYLRIGQLWLNEGEWDGQQLIDPEYIRRARFPQFPEANAGYGFLTWPNSNIPGKTWYSPSKIRKGYSSSPNPNAPEDMYVASGARGQIIYIVPSYGITMMTMGATDNPSGENGETNTRVWDAMKPALGEPPCGQCTFQSEMPGCGNAAIEECVCRQLGAELCCTNEWHAICSQLAVTGCQCGTMGRQKK